MLVKLMEYETICQQCGNTKKMIPSGVSMKTGKPVPYKAFSVCETCKPKKDYQKSARKDDDQGELILEGIKIINERITKMAEYLKDKLEVRK